MSIVLKTDPKQLAPFAHVTASQHDAIAMHATQMAIGEAQAANLSQLSDDGIRAWLACVRLIRDNAAANLARLMGEGK